METDALIAMLFRTKCEVFSAIEIGDRSARREVY